MIDSILCEVGSWLLVNKLFKDCFMNLFMRDWVSCISMYPRLFHVRSGGWVPPMVRKVKVNFDGCIMRDSFGSIIYVKGGGNGDAIVAEVVGFLESLCMI